MPKPECEFDRSCSLCLSPNSTSTIRRGFRGWGPRQAPFLDNFEPKRGLERFKSGRRKDFRIDLAWMGTTGTRCHCPLATCPRNGGERPEIARFQIQSICSSTLTRDRDGGCTMGECLGVEANARDWRRYS